MSYVHLLVIAYNLDYRFSMMVALGPVFVATGVLVVWTIYRDQIT